MIHLTIDKQAITVAEGRTLLEACREHGIYVPTLCYHPALAPYGGCRLCVVEVIQPPRPPRLVASCVHPCEEGAVVQTDTEAVRRSRRITAELLLSRSYNAPEIVALAKELGVEEIRYKMPEVDACVLCGLCVRACQEIVGVSAISMIKRGIARQVSPPFHVEASRCIGCGTCVLICPTGVLKLSDVSGCRSVHPVDSDYQRLYCQVCGDASLSLVEEVELDSLA
ncbi:MAG: (2Fe-2S)-binding protein [Thermoflexales bacterium]|nr:(2Fe-2S)-binding protein [Thermoflexales bacterium]